MFLHDPAGLVMQDVDADLLQDAQGGEVEGFQLVVRHQFGWGQGVLQLPEGRLLEGRARAGALARAAAAAGAIGCQCRFGGMKGGGHGKPRRMQNRPA